MCIYIYSSKKKKLLMEFHTTDASESDSTPLPNTPMLLDKKKNKEKKIHNEEEGMEIIKVVKDDDQEIIKEVKEDDVNKDDLKAELLIHKDRLEVESTQRLRKSITIKLEKEDEEDSDEQRAFPCKYCERKFYSSQAVRGHQNAHKTERVLAKRRKLMASEAALFHYQYPNNYDHDESPYSLASLHHLYDPFCFAKSPRQNNNTSSFGKVPMHSTLAHLQSRLSMSRLLDQEPSTRSSSTNNILYGDNELENINSSSFGKLPLQSTLAHVQSKLMSRLRDQEPAPRSSPKNMDNDEIAKYLLTRGFKSADRSSETIMERRVSNKYGENNPSYNFKQHDEDIDLSLKL